MRTEGNILLSDLMNGMPYLTKGALNGIRIRAITADSKQVREGDLFIAIRGTKHDGHHFLEEAIHRGAVAVIIERPYSHPTVKVLQVSDSKKCLSHLAAVWYQFPSKKLRVIGITGTNGKTTISYLLEQLLQKEKIGVIGTISYRVGTRVIPSTQTTPSALELQGLLAEMAKNQLGFAVLEVSSHALDQSRVADVEFQIGIFTNLSQDHLDYHETMQAYGSCKLKLFQQLSRSSYAIVNSDDPFTPEIVRSTEAKIIRYGFSQQADVRAESFSMGCKEGKEGMEMRIHTPKGPVSMWTPLMGRHNVYNLLAAFCAGIVLEKSVTEITKALEQLGGVPGRLEKFESSLGFRVFVDYAHTPDGLRQVLSTLREITSGRLWVVFGCGGDRDRTKRSQMGEVAVQLADEILLTSDNPRNEDPNGIIQEVMEGVRSLEKKAIEKVKVVVDRASAIQWAVFSAQSGDTVLLAGKGHESYQIFKNVTIPFDDRQQTRHWITQREAHDTNT